MKRLDSAAADAAAAAKAERHRRYQWCRLWNGFLDDPLLRVVAARTKIPLATVQAFVARLDSFANAAEPRGYVGDFNAAEFAAAHAIPVEEAASLFAALEHPDVGWVEQEHVARFYTRNPDKEDLTVNERKRRSRARSDIRKELARRVRQGLLEPLQRDGVEATLELLPDADLFALHVKLRRGVALEAALSGLSTGHAGHNVTDRDIVTVTPRAERKASTGEVENGGDSVPVSGEEATAWLLGRGREIVAARLEGDGAGPEARITRWRRDLGDDAALRALIEAADGTDYVGARFHNLIVDGIRRRRQVAEKGEPLPFGPSLQLRRAENG